ncbi:tubulin epsilon and delta complex protein 1-like [Halichondria panicea]|uniref:tubulin epsilon and delta complex protein 1-like n=1 Tax=Halichondria panicea TaxID=6063 RepID=UPI00312B8B31
MAAKVQQGIRSVIQTLLSLLEDAGIPRMPSESFRKAKFNQPEAIASFWTTLFNIIELSNSLEYSKITPVIQLPSNEQMSLFVRKHLFTLGYNRTNFFKNPICSRELVLAFSWLLYKSDLPNKLTQFHLRAANTVSIPLKTTRKFLVETMEKEIERFKEDVEQIQKYILNYDCKDKEQLEAALKKLEWLKRKMECRFKSALSSQHGYQKRSDKIRQYTWRPSHNEHLSVHEVFLLRHPEQLSNYMQNLEKHLMALQRLMEWKTCESLFWQWMESVLDLDEKELLKADSCSDDNDEGGGKPVLDREQLESSLRILEKEVASLIERNRPHIEKINRTWLMKSRSVRAEDIEAELAKINLTDNHKPLKMFTEEDTAFVETLGSVDVALRLPAREKSSKQRSYQLSSTLEQERVCSNSLQALNVKLEQVQNELDVTKERAKIAKNAVTRQLERIEQTLPPNVCKLET